MKKTLSILLTCSLALTFSSTLQAAQQYDTYEAAQKHVTDDGFILFFYPAGWDKYGEKLCKKLIADAKVRAAAGKAALILAPVYQRRNDETTAQAKKAMGPLAYPRDMGDISYPALVFYEKEGRQYTTLHGEALMTANTEEVAALVKAKMDAKHKQDDILVKSRNATDAKEKNRLLLESSQVAGLEWPGGLKEAMQNNDASDTYGYRSTLDFGFGAKGGESMDDFVKRLDEALKNPNLSTGQKQRACAAAIGHIRRAYGPMAGGPLITKYAKAMHKLDPKSALGLSAPVVMRDWVRVYRYGMGWSNEIIPAGTIPMLMQDMPMKKPGTYTVTFKLTTGRDAVHIKRLRLMDGDKCIASDDTPREVNWSNTQQTYTFKVKKALKSPALEITYGNAADKRSTWGDITVNAQ